MFFLEIFQKKLMYTNHNIANNLSSPFVFFLFYCIGFLIGSFTLKKSLRVLIFKIFVFKYIKIIYIFYFFKNIYNISNK